MATTDKFMSGTDMRLNPLAPNLDYEGIIKKVSYERRVYESVDDKSLFCHFG